MVFFALWILLFAYFSWRFLAQLRRRADIRREVTSLTFLTAVALLFLISLFTPQVSQPVAAAVLIVTFLAVVLINLYLFRRYDQWLKEQEEK